MRVAARPPRTECTLTRARPLLGTLVEIRAHGSTAKGTQDAIDRAFAVVSHVHARMSYHAPDSDVSRLNRAGAAVVEVDPHTWKVLDAARRVSDASGGVFDVTVATALAAHGLLPRHTGHAAPERTASWRDIALRPDHRVELRRPLHIDLGGIAKGYAVDCALDSLRRAGMHSACVNAGGDLRRFGDTPEVIHIRDPREPTRLMPLCAMTEGAVATSAPYFSGRFSRGRMVSALFDGQTRIPCCARSSVSVVADDCVVADALTKVVHADFAGAPRVLEAFGSHAVVLDADAAGRVRLSQSGAGGWRSLPPKPRDGAAA